MELQIPAAYKRRDIPGNTKTKHVQFTHHKMDMNYNKNCTTRLQFPKTT